MSSNWLRYVFRQEDSGDNAKINYLLSFLWIFPILVPLLTIVFTYLLQGWSWGLMDDPTILILGSGVLDRTCEYFSFLWRFGQFKPTLALYAGLFYTPFENYPNWMYILKAITIAFLLLIWGTAAYRVTKKSLSILLFAAITLSFHYFYDAFFYLSSQEMVGLLFCGVAFHFFLNNLESILGEDLNNLNSGETKKKSLALGSFILGVFFLFCAFCAKEPFVSCGIAFGLSYLYLALSNRKNNRAKLSVLGIALIVMTLLYGCFLLIFVRRAYTAGYVFSIPQFILTFQSWFKKDFLNHLPWIMGAAFIFYLGEGYKKIWKNTTGISFKIKWGIILGFFLYTGYLSILLPWNTTAYYATPFGPFFAFVICLLVTGYLTKAPIKIGIFFAVCALMFNMFVCQYALERESTYQYDTKNFMEWVHENPIFSNNRDSYNIFCNAMEAAGAIPRLISRKWNLNLETFHYATDPYAIFDGKKADFFLYSTRYSKFDLDKLKGWEIVFWSKSWRMYRKVY